MNRDSSRTAPDSVENRARRVRRLAWLLDESIRLPGGIRLGVDGVLGLIPGIGDLSGAVIGAYIIHEARALGAPKRLLMRMGMNLAFETIVGSIPLVGDLFDIYYKANIRNLALLNRFLGTTK